MTSRLFQLCLALVAVLAGGCRVDQANEVATYRAIIDIATTQPSYESGPLELRQAMLMANAENERLAVEGEDFLRTVIARRRSIANFLPTVDLVPTLSFREDLRNNATVVPDPLNPTGPGLVSSSSNDNVLFDAPVDLSINLFNGFQDINAYWRDTYAIIARRNNLLAYQEGFLLDVARAYYQVLRSEATVRVLDASLQTQDERLREARGRVQAGLASPLVEAQIAAQQSATRSLLIAAQRDVKQLRSTLVVLLGRALWEVPLVDDTDSLRAGAIGALDAMISAAKAYRSEIAASQAAIAAARREVEVAFGQYWPSVSVDFSAFLYRESPPSARDWEALIRANIPIFAAGRIRADVREAWSFHRQALLLGSVLGREIEGDVRQAHAAVTASDLRLAEAQVQLSAAQASLRQAEESYRVGIATNLDRVQAQEDLLEAQLLLTSERFDRQILRLELLRATGQLREWLAG